MKPKFLLCLALVLSGQFNAAIAVENAAKENPLPSAGQMYRSTDYGFEFSLPQGWTVRETNFYIAHYSDGFLTVNSQRPNLILSSGWGNSKPLSQQMQPGEVYISFGYSGFPGPETMRADTVGGDLQARLATNRIQLRLADGFVPCIEQRSGFGAVAGAEAFLFAGFGIVNIKHSAQFSAVKSASVFHSSNFLVRACQTRSGDRCISYTKRTANCVSASRA